MCSVLRNLESRSTTPQPPSFPEARGAFIKPASRLELQEIEGEFVFVELIVADSDQTVGSETSSNQSPAILLKDQKRLFYTVKPRLVVVTVGDDEHTYLRRSLTSRCLKYLLDPKHTPARIPDVFPAIIGRKSKENIRVYRVPASAHLSIPSKRHTKYDDHPGCPQDKRSVDPKASLPTHPAPLFDVIPRLPLSQPSLRRRRRRRRSPLLLTLSFLPSCHQRHFPFIYLPSSSISAVEEHLTNPPLSRQVEAASASKPATQPDPTPLTTASTSLIVSGCVVVLCWVGECRLTCVIPSSARRLVNPSSSVTVLFAIAAVSFRRRRLLCRFPHRRRHPPSSPLFVILPRRDRYARPRNARFPPSTYIGDNQDFPGVYTENGQVMTYKQPPEELGAISTMPYQPKVPASSECSPFTSSLVYTGLPTPTKSIVTTPTATGTGAAGSSATGTNKGAASGTTSGKSASQTGTTDGNGASELAPVYPLSAWLTEALSCQRRYIRREDVFEMGVLLIHLRGSDACADFGHHRPFLSFVELGIRCRVGAYGTLSVIRGFVIVTSRYRRLRPFRLRVCDLHRPRAPWPTALLGQLDSHLGEDTILMILSKKGKSPQSPYRHGIVTSKSRWSLSGHSISNGGVPHHLGFDPADIVTVKTPSRSLALRDEVTIGILKAPPVPCQLIDFANELQGISGSKSDRAFSNPSFARNQVQVRCDIAAALPSEARLAGAHVTGVEQSARSVYK
ncbi:hypothetical protein NMY22_g7378 [Coprinellus aureogranulatus]|nr:hypothetical protein NMY22_g7378 [Coprinellus aureogranulatus]